MKKWNFRLKSNPQEIINKLNSSLETVDGFVFNIDHDKNDSVIFNMRKRVQYPDQILHRNRIIVNGKILKTDIENETEVDISFTQHFITVLTIFSISVLGLFAIIAVIDSRASMYISGGIFLVAGFFIWIDLNKKFEKDIQNYKTLISEILEFKK